MLKPLAMILALAAPALAAAQYEAPAKSPDQAAQLAEMVELYDTVCLHAFPDDDAAAQAVSRYRATRLSAEELRRFLHDDPGMGWDIEGRTGLFHLTIEQSPPYHACAVRVMTAGFSDLGPYRAAAARYENGGGYAAIASMDRVIDDLRVVGSGERRTDSDGNSEALLLAITTPAGDGRSGGRTAVEVRFAHQYVQAPAAGAPGKAAAN